MNEDREPYTAEPTHLRIFEDGGEWFLDGADNSLDYTEMCWSFDSSTEAFEAIQEFIEAAEECGVTFKWDAMRTGVARHVSTASYALRYGESHVQPT